MGYLSSMQAYRRRVRSIGSHEFCSFNSASIASFSASSLSLGLFTENGGVLPHWRVCWVAMVATADAWPALLDWATKMSSREIERLTEAVHFVQPVRTVWCG